MKQVIFYIALFVMFPLSTNAQEKQQLAFTLLYNGAPLELGKNITSNSNEALTIDVFKMYISNLTFYLNDKKTGATKEVYILLDAEKPRSLLRAFKTKRKGYNRISFNVGIDSVTNHKGIGPNALDPSNNMYWTWQNGYINMKLEGTSAKAPTRNNKFQFHIGGYQHPANTLQKVEINISNIENSEIQIDIASFLSTIDLTTQHTLMRPNEEAVQLANKIPLMFIKNEN
jgi:hypothetical protein